MQKFFKSLLDRLYLRLKSPEATRQVGALPYKIVDSQLLLLLVTSRRSGRWIYPKGSRIKGLENWESAALEALEEAGIEGDVAREPIGTFRAIKRVGQTRSVVEVDLYPLRVTKQHAKWQEMQQRQRLWVPLNEATRLLAEPVLAEHTVTLSQRVMTEGASSAGKSKK
jgi:8-oxo-dGTP pyrophosphatase MutT (NUDIX family)